MNNEAKLYLIDECPDLMVDGYVFDTAFNMLFISLWGRDTAIQSFIARLTLSQDEQGLKEIHILNEARGSLPVHFGLVDRLQKKISRTQRRSLFGALTNLWLFDARLVKAESTSSFLLLPNTYSETVREQRLWQMVKDTCPLPLLDHWKNIVLSILEETQMLTMLPDSGIGKLSSYALALDIDKLRALIGHEIKSDVLLAA